MRSFATARSAPTSRPSARTASRSGARSRSWGFRTQSGCSGFAYTYEIADDLRDGERVFEDHGASLVVDAKSLAFIDGARFDFVTEGLKQAFQVENPNVDGTCGCGESFTLKARVA